MKTAILFTLTLVTAAHADPKARPPVDEGTVEHFESQVRERSCTRITTTETPTRSVVERAWSSSFDESWSSATYTHAEWTTDEGHRSDEIRDQKTTIRTRTRPIRIVPRFPVRGMTTP